MHVIDLLSAYDDQLWNRFSIVYEVKIVHDQVNLRHITSQLYDFLHGIRALIIGAIAEH